MRGWIGWLGLGLLALGQGSPAVQEFAVPPGQHPHDVAPAPDGRVWYTAQLSGELGSLDPKTGQIKLIKLGPGSRPHGVIVGPDGAPWVTDGGLNAVLRVDPKTQEVRVFPLNIARNANLNTATFDHKGMLWFTGQSGYYGRVDPKTGKVETFEAPRGAGPYGIHTTPSGRVFFASLAGSYVGEIDVESGKAKVLEPPTKDQGARRVWSDSKNRVWVSAWNTGQLAMYDSTTGQWKEWKLPGNRPQAYAVYVDETDKVWVSDFGNNAMLRFDPETQKFETFPLPSSPANVRQILGRAGEVWGAESGVDKLIVFRR